MALLQNIQILNAEPIRRSAAATGNERNNFGPTLCTCLNKYAADNGDGSAPIGLPPPESRQHMFAGAAVPAGYYPGYGAWFPPRTSGALVLHQRAVGAGTITNSNLAGGINMASAIPGIGLLVSDITGKGWLTAVPAGAGSVSADIIGAFFAVAALAGTGDLTVANLEAIANLAAVLAGVGDIPLANLAGGINMAATIAGLGDITQADLGALASLIAAIPGTGDITVANIGGVLWASASIAGIGDVTTADLSALASLLASIAGVGDITLANLEGRASISSIITGQGLITLANLAGGWYLTAALAGDGLITVAALTGIGWLTCVIHIGYAPSAYDIQQAIWNALAAAYNTPGTMGQLLNAAGAGGDPWLTPLPGAYLAGTAGRIIGSDIKGKTDNLPVDPASQALTDAEITAMANDLITRVKGLNDIYDSVQLRALEATLTAIKGAGWTNETLKYIKELIAVIPTGGNIHFRV